jgi:cysteinyl-tRNA synthetase
MSKSLGNSFFLFEALKIYSGEIIRFYLLSSHYRADFNFSEEDLLASKKRLDKLYRLKKRLYGGNGSKPNNIFIKNILNSLCDDLNTSKALSYIDAMIAEANEELDINEKNKSLKKEILANIDWIDKVLGFGGSDAYDYFQHGINSNDREKINNFIDKRNIAKKEKDFKTADEIREELKNMGIALMDTANGTVWEKV